MPIIKKNFLSDTKEIQLWHAPMSSCSQRVRLVLHYHNIKFKNHLIRLDRGEHASKSFLKINPSGLVPVIADNSLIINESNDIIKYVDEKFGSALLTDNFEKNLINSFLKELDYTQNSLKLCTFNFLFKSSKRMSDKDYSFFRANHKNEKLVKFYSDFEIGFNNSEISAAVNFTKDFFLKVENLIDSKCNCVFHQGLSLADISLIPNVHRFTLMDWPFERYPKIYSWYKNIKKYDWFKKAIIDWEPPELINTFKNYVKKSISISSFL